MGVDYEKFQNDQETYLSPPRSELETFWGRLTRIQYEFKDPSLNHFRENIFRTSLTTEQYMKLKDIEKQRKKPKKTKDPSDELLLYAIDFRKNSDLNDTSGIVRIPLDNPFFLRFKEKRPQFRVQTLDNGSHRLIYHSGQQINHRATTTLYGRVDKEKKNDVRLKGMVYVICTRSSDLKLKGCLPLTTEWTPHLDSGDQVTAGDPDDPQPDPMDETS